MRPRVRGAVVAILGALVAACSGASGPSKGDLDLNAPTEAPHHVAADTCGPAPKGLGPGLLPQGDDGSGGGDWALTPGQKQGITDESAKKTPALKVLAQACYVPQAMIGSDCAHCTWLVEFCPRQLPLGNCESAPDGLPRISIYLKGKPQGSDFGFDIDPIEIEGRSYWCKADQKTLTAAALRALPGYAPQAKTKGWHIIIVEEVPFRCWGPGAPRRNRADQPVREADPLADSTRSGTGLAPAAAEADQH